MKNATFEKKEQVLHKVGANPVFSLKEPVPALHSDVS